MKERNMVTVEPLMNKLDRLDRWYGKLSVRLELSGGDATIIKQMDRNTKWRANLENKLRLMENGL